MVKLHIHVVESQIRIPLMLIGKNTIMKNLAQFVKSHLMM